MKIKYLLVIIILMFNMHHYILKDCVLKVDRNYPPLVINETDPKNLTIVRNLRKIVVKERDLILVLCPGGMKYGLERNPRSVSVEVAFTNSSENSDSRIKRSDGGGEISEHDTKDDNNNAENDDANGITNSPSRTTRAISPPTANNFSVICKNGAISGISKEGIVLNNFAGVKCETRNRFEIFMKVGHGTCSHNYYAIGIKLNEDVYEFAQICFDLRGMKPTFVRFIARPVRVELARYKSYRALDHKEKWWERDQRYKTAAERKLVKKKTSDYIDLELPNYNFFIASDKIQTLQHEKFGKHRDIVFYDEVNLYPTEFFGTFFRGIIPDKFKLQTTVGWDALFMGNWRIFLADLVVRIREVSYEIYIGTSHTAQAPKAINCLDLSDLVLYDNGKELSIPQYIWAYLINPNERIVIIGVNTPYYPIWDHSNPLPCETICNEIPWLKMLKKFARVSTFGLIYCCPVSSVEKFLQGFPKFDYPKDK